MKRLSIILVTAMACLDAHAISVGEIGGISTPDYSCLSIEDVCGSLMVGTSGYACETGETKCLDGWTKSGDKCYHSNTSGSDSTGTYTITYPPCNVKKCHTFSSTYSGICVACSIESV